MSILHDDFAAARSFLGTTLGMSPAETAALPDDDVKRAHAGRLVSAWRAAVETGEGDTKTTEARLSGFMVEHYPGEMLIDPSGLILFVESSGKLIARYPVEV
jgi:hypothetical protein